MKKLCRKHCLLINDIRDPLIFPFSLTSTIEKHTFPSHVKQSHLWSWVALPLRSRFYPSLIQLLLIHAIQMLFSLKAISYSHYAYIKCTNLTSKAKGVLYSRNFEILVVREGLSWCNFSFHLSWLIVKKLTWKLGKINPQVAEKWKTCSSQ